MSTHSLSVVAHTPTHSGGAQPGLCLPPTSHTPTVDPFWGVIFLSLRFFTTISLSVLSFTNTHLRPHTWLTFLYYLPPATQQMCVSVYDWTPLKKLQQKQQQQHSDQEYQQEVKRQRDIPNQQSPLSVDTIFDCSPTTDCSFFCCGCCCLCKYNHRHFPILLPLLLPLHTDNTRLPRIPSLSLYI